MSKTVVDVSLWPKEVDRLLDEAAKLAAEHGLPTEAFMAAAWEHCLDSHPGLRQELEDKQLKSELKKLRKRGLVATA
jgi:hypothetical protein